MNKLRKNMFNIICLSLALSACSDNDSINNTEIDGITKTYSITIHNLTNNQIMSPPAAILHDTTFSAWSVGSLASEAIERLAEGGDNSSLLSLQNNNPTYDAAAPLMPGTDITFTLSTNSIDEFTKLTIASMLISTNDAFSGINALDISPLSTGESIKVNGYVYDAGTENNFELTGTIPGLGGEGYNAENDDITKRVSMHSGVVTADDGYAESSLNQSHKFDNIAMKITITAL